MAGKYLILASLCAIAVLLVVFLPMAMNPASPAGGQPAEKGGECLIWDSASQRYAPMAKLCARDEDCTAYAQVFLNYAVLDVAALDASKVRCSDTSFSRVMKVDGGAYQCSSDRDCFLAFLDNSRMHQGDVPPEVSASLAEVFVCKSGSCEAPARAKELWAEEGTGDGEINEVIAD